MSDELLWTLEDAVALCVAVEAICPNYGCHVALTGGVLYKEGRRKDCDLLFYRIRQCPEISMAGLWEALGAIGLSKIKGEQWCQKAHYNGKAVDCLFPDLPGEVYPEDEPAPTAEVTPCP